MQGNASVLEDLNQVLKAELVAINQYFLHAEMQANWGYQRLAAHTRKESIGEMKHAEQLIERILFLEGGPQMAGPLALQIGPTVEAQLRNDLALELVAVPKLNEAIQAAVAAGDNGSRELFESILVDEESHVDFLEAQLTLIEQMGIENYLAEQMREEA
ncbi:MAG: bacterioferritin [Myxococcota bacterium]